jgi:hypothetical protein
LASERRASYTSVVGAELRREEAMRRSPLKYVLALGVASSAGAILPSCATNDSMMFIIGVYARKAGACDASPEEDSPLWDRGVMDRAFVGEYRAALLLGNQLTQRGSRDRLRTETSRVSLKGAEITLETVDGRQLLEPFSAIATGFVDAASGTDPGLAIMAATLIPARAAEQLPDGVVVAKVRAFGTSLGGQDVESNELAFPIEICTGCLVTYPASARDLTAMGDDYQCKLATDDAATADTDLPCTLGMDLPVPCTFCSGFSDVCQSPANNCYYTPNGPDCPTP